MTVFDILTGLSHAAADYPDPPVCTRGPRKLVWTSLMRAEQPLQHRAQNISNLAGVGHGEGR